MKCLVISGERPISVSSLTLWISTTSSVTRRCPRLISSRAVSLFPMPLSPIISSPSPYTSTSTPWMEMHGASSTFSHRIISAMNWEVFLSVEKTGIFLLFASASKNSSGWRLRQNIRQGISYDRNVLYTSFFFSSSSICKKEYSTYPITCTRSDAKWSK